MFKHKKGIAILVMICFIATFLPSAAFASTDVQQFAETVVYNLADQEVTVGTDAETAGQTPNLYKLFEADGSYTIQLEDNAFFPYEVQFQANGTTETVWFETPDSVVNIGGHDFRVKTNQTDANQIAQLSFKVGDKTVVAYPKEKTFTAKPRPATRTLLPIPCENLRANFTDMTPAEMNMVTVQAILSGVDTSGKTIMYTKDRSNADFKQISADTHISVGSFNDHHIQFIVGSGKQLDPENVRYDVYIDWEFWNRADWIMFDMSAQDKSGQRTNGVLSNVNSNWSGSIQNTDLLVDFKSLDTLRGSDYYLGLKPSDLLSQKGYAVKIFDTIVSNPEELKTAKDITSELWNVDLTANNSGYLLNENSKGNFFTAALYDGQTLVGFCPISIEVYYTESEFLGYDAELSDANGNRVDYKFREMNYKEDVDITEFALHEKDPYNGTYTVSYKYYKNDGPVPADQISNYVNKAVEGSYSSLDEVKDLPDIKDQLLGQGYQTKFDNHKKVFTVFLKSGQVVRRGVYLYNVPNVQPSIPPEVKPLQGSDPYLQLEGVSQWDASGSYKSLNDYAVRKDDDGYYANGYQTVLVLNEDADLTKIVPQFSLAEGVHVYVNGEQQKPGATPQDFSKGPVLYSVAAENGVNLKNYWITVVKKNAAKSELFVNGANKKDENGKIVREVFINASSNNKHDIFISNLGAKPLTGLKVELSKDAQNIALDEYWTVGGEGNSSMLPFTQVVKPNYPDEWGQIPNVAKIRLLSKGQGDVKGTLTLTADEIEPVVIELTGTTKPPRIITEKIPDAVKYVPYETLIQTDNMYDSNNITFKLGRGKLPRGLYLLPDGEIYGTPTEAGTFEISVAATINGTRGDEGRNTIRIPFTLTVLDNTDSNVGNATDTGYGVSIKVPEYMETYEDKVFESQGALDEFTDFWLDGEKLVRNQDYIAENGSTKITIKAQTFKKRGTGKHTIAAEFHPNHNRKQLKRAAQNYQIQGKRPGGGGGGHIVPPKPEPPKPVPPKPEPPKPDTIKEFKDVPAHAWYAEVVKWANKTGYMVGVGNQMFAPNAQVSVATVVTVLSRVGKIDLTQYEGQSFPDVPEGQWYTNPGKWVKATNLLGDMKFSAEPPIARAKIAILLVNFFEQVGVDVPEVKNPVAFNDADQMSAEEQDAFQKLYQMGIFKGVGNNKMNPKGNTTRAELAALLQRVNNTLAK